MKKLIPFLNSIANKRFGGGYANGYVAVPPEHPWYGKAYSEIEGEIDIHGGLTFSGRSDRCHNIETINDNSNSLPEGWWVFGFDTLHDGDTTENWGKERCIKETLKLKAQLEKVG